MTVKNFLENIELALKENRINILDEINVAGIGSEIIPVVNLTLPTIILHPDYRQIKETSIIFTNKTKK